MLNKGGQRFARSFPGENDPAETAETHYPKTISSSRFSETFPNSGMSGAKSEMRYSSSAQPEGQERGSSGLAVQRWNHGCQRRRRRCIFSRSLTMGSEESRPNRERMARSRRGYSRKPAKPARQAKSLRKSQASCSSRSSAISPRLRSLRLAAIQRWMSGRISKISSHVFPMTAAASYQCPLACSLSAANSSGDLGKAPLAAPSAASRMSVSSEVPPGPRRGSSTFAIRPSGNFFFR